MVEYYRDRHWTDLPVAEIGAGGGWAYGLSYMTTEAARYYLPGFLLVALDHPDFNELKECIVSHLSDSKPSKYLTERDVVHLRECQEELLGGYTVTQLALILGALEKLRQDSKEVSREFFDPAIEFMKRQIAQRTSAG